jgi:hypothetical protein
MTKLHDKSFLIENDILIICVCNQVYALQLNTLDLSWKLEANWATCFSIHKLKDGFVTHGELQITKFNLKGEILWQFAAEDIFVTFDNEKSFIIEEDIIIVQNWFGFEYHIHTSNGKLVKKCKVKS